MKRKILMGFCVLIMLFSVTSVALQAFDYVKAMNCAKFCDDAYPESDPLFKACFKGCFYGPDE